MREGRRVILYPAIDILDGRAVRLVQGRFEDSTVYADDPLAGAGFRDKWSKPNSPAACSSVGHWKSTRAAFQEMHDRQDENPSDPGGHAAW